jgi:hypothetical protein
VGVGVAWPVLTVVLLLRSLENQPMTLDALHAGPWTSTFRSPRDILATGHAPNVLQFNIWVKVLASISAKSMHGWLAVSKKRSNTKLSIFSKNTQSW